MQVSAQRTDGEETKLMASSNSEPTSPTAKEMFKLVLVRIATKTTSRYGVTLFLFCSSLWLLTQAFMALHSGCWIQKPKALSPAQEKSADCRRALAITRNEEQVANLTKQLSYKKFIAKHSESNSNIQPAIPGVQHMVQPANSGPQNRPISVNAEVEVKSISKKSIESVAGVKPLVVKSQTPLNVSVRVQPLGNGIKQGAINSPKVGNNSAGNGITNNKAGVPPKVNPDRPQEKSSQPLAAKQDLHIQGKLVVNNKPGVEMKPVSSNLQMSQSTRNRTYIPYPQGQGKPALQPVPYQLPQEASDLIVKMTPKSWETMGCVDRVTFFTPGLNFLPGDYKWKEFSESFKKYRMGYYFLKCPAQVCDLVIRVGASADLIVNGGAVLVGATAKTMSGKTRAVMEEVKRKTPDNLLKIYLLALDNSPMMNYYDPYMANFEYHYSMTYHSRADVSIPFGRYIRGKDVEQERNWAEGRTRLVAWVEDNCDKTFWPRLEYVQELRKYIPIDIYGKCGDLECKSTHCVEELKHYKFYLALEEAPCDEFITLNFWERGLKSGAVPIVYGGRKHAYKSIAPPTSFIHIADFSGPADLADYLVELSKENWEYNRFHKWRTEGSIETSYPGFKLESLCHIVPHLIHQSPPKRKVMSRGKFYRSCRKGVYVNGFAGQGDLQNWTPWRNT